MHRYKFNSLQDDVARRQLQKQKEKEQGEKERRRGGRHCLAILSDIFYILICIRIFRLPAKKDYANTKQSRRKRRQTAKAVDKVRPKAERERERVRESEGDRLIEYLDFCTCQYEERKPPPAQLENPTSLAFSMCVSHAFVAFSSFSFFHSSSSSFFMSSLSLSLYALFAKAITPAQRLSLLQCVCVCVCGCCLYLYSNHQTFARVSCTRTTFKCDRVCVRVCACVCVGNKFAKAKRKWLVCPARGSGVAKGWQGVAVGGNFHFS